MYALNEIDGVGSQMAKCLGSDWGCHFNFVKLMNIGPVHFCLQLIDPVVYCFFLYRSVVILKNQNALLCYSFLFCYDLP